MFLMGLISILYFLRVDSIVFDVASDETDEHDARPVIYGNYQPVLVSTDVENDAIVSKNTCVSIARLDVGRRTPVGNACFMKPRPQRLLGITAMGSCPELHQSFTSNYSHEIILTWSHNGIKQNIFCKPVRTAPETGLPSYNWNVLLWFFVWNRF